MAHKKNKKIIIEISPIKRRGHQPKRSGAGEHGDKRKRRESQKIRKYLEE